MAEKPNYNTFGSSNSDSCLNLEPPTRPAPAAAVASQARGAGAGAGAGASANAPPPAWMDPNRDHGGAGARPVDIISSSTARPSDNPLRQTLLTVSSAEETASATMVELDAQGEQLRRAHASIRGTRDAAHSAGARMRGMAWRAARNRAMLLVVIIAELVAIAAVVWVRYIAPHAPRHSGGGGGSAAAGSGGGHSKPQ